MAAEELKRVYALMDPKQTGTVVEVDGKLCRVRWDNEHVTWISSNMLGPLEENPLPEKQDNA